MIIGENRCGTDKDPVAQLCGFVDEGVVLHLAVIPKVNAGSHVGSPPDYTVFAEDGVLTNLGQMPNAGSLTNHGRGRNVSRFNDANHASP